MSQGFDARSLLDSLLSGGRELAQRGEDYAAGRLGVGDDAQSRDALRKGALGGAAAAGALALLLGTKPGRRIGGAGLALGGLAALGKFAYDKWQGHQAEQAAAAPEPPVDRLEGPKAEGRARLLLTAMVAAAKADGHVDADERKAIEDGLSRMDGDARTLLLDALSGPADAASVAAGATDPQSKAEVYAVSAMICDETGPEERAYLDELAGALGLPPREAADIELGLRAG